MDCFIKKFFLLFICFALIVCGMPQMSIGHDSFVRGEKTSDEAAQYKNEQLNSDPAEYRSIGFEVLSADTTGTALYEEEDRNLVKEIIVWTIGAAFVGYFIVKVFLEGDTEETGPDKPVKEIPGGNVNTGVLFYSF